MFKQSTVILLGAGASCHYGYPTGEGLIDRIIDTIKNTKFAVQYNQADKIDYLLSGGTRKDKISLYELDQNYKKLCDYLEFYDPLSIDLFLSQFSNDPAILNAGKTMIAYEILAAEDQRLLQRFEPEEISRKRYHPAVPATPPSKIRNENWYRFLIHALIADATPERLLADELNLHIITFNYDISLEYALYSRFINSPLLGQNAEQFLKKISDNIIHIYGQVGKFQWKGGGDRTNESYGAYRRSDDAYRQADTYKNSLFVIGQDRDSQVKKNVIAAKKWLTSAECVYFLGFGFNDDNINLLELKNIPEARTINCTNYGDSKIIEQKITTLFSRFTSGPIRKPNISVKKVYEALAGDFSLLS